MSNAKYRSLIFQAAAAMAAMCGPNMNPFQRPPQTRKEEKEILEFSDHVKKLSDDSDKARAKFKERQMREFSVGGCKVLAYSRKDAITRLKATGQITRKKKK